jgi:P22_AR N-terminal domain
MTNQQGSAVNNVSTRPILHQIKVPCHGAELHVVEHDGQPYAPMKPIVEGIGVSWQGQHAKLAANGRRWGVSRIS